MNTNSKAIVVLAILLAASSAAAQDARKVTGVVLSAAT